jgi:hypothetical protein
VKHNSPPPGRVANISEHPAKRFPNLHKGIPLRLRHVGVWAWPFGPEPELTGYWTIEDLLSRSDENTFAFQHLLVQCLLFTAALDLIELPDFTCTLDDKRKWRAKEHRRKLIGIARTTCEMIHFHAQSNASQKLLARRGLKITGAQLDDLDSNFFLPIGGHRALIFAPSLQDLFIEINQKIDSLIVPLAIAHYFDCLGWTHYHGTRHSEDATFLSRVKGLGTLRCAYSAVAQKLLDLPYFQISRFELITRVVPYSPKMPAPPREIAHVRSLLRRAPPTVMLLYCMLDFFSTLAHNWSLPSVFASLLNSQAHPRSLRRMLAAARRNISPILERENKTVRSWLNFSDCAEFDDRVYERPPLSRVEIEHLYELVGAQRGRPKRHRQSEING